MTKCQASNNQTVTSFNVISVCRM